jgi:Predicted amidophosphoribosyltransferases
MNSFLNLARRCLLCHSSFTNSDLDLCSQCTAELPFAKYYCGSCGKILSHSSTKCGRCIQTNLATKINTIVLFQYCYPIDQLILKVKFSSTLQSLIITQTIGKLFASTLATYYLNRARPQVIIPVPLHAKRLTERGYNQTLEIAKPIAKKLATPIDKLSIRRIKNTTPQARLDAKSRVNNVKGAFQAADKLLYYKHLAVIDDVITTGSTIKEVCSTLAPLKPNQIDIWCLASN